MTEQSIPFNENADTWILIYLSEYFSARENGEEPPPEWKVRRYAVEQSRQTELVIYG